ncbi:MAG: hypothetical protein ACYTER_10530, partial [Planctomycetota bacterium]
VENRLSRQPPKNNNEIMQEKNSLDLLEKRKTLHRQAAEAGEKLARLEENLTELQPLANLGLAWAMTAHELNNMLMPVLNYSQLALHNTDATRPA